MTCGTHDWQMDGGAVEALTASLVLPERQQLHQRMSQHKREYWICQQDAFPYCLHKVRVPPPLSPVHQLGMEKRGNQNVRAITSVPWWRGSRCSEWIEWKGMVAVYFSVPVAPLWAAWVGCERRHQHDTHATLWKLNRCFWGRFHVIWSNTGHLSGTPSCCQLIHS